MISLPRFYGGFLSSPMIQYYATALVNIMDDLRTMEAEIKKTSTGISEKTVEQINHLLAATTDNCKYLNLRSATKQLLSMVKKATNHQLTYPQFASMLAELRIRIEEDLDDRVFYSIIESAKIDKFFKEDPDAKARGILIPKTPEEWFDERVIAHFKDTLDDVDQAGKCFLFEAYTGCVFHLMRVVEYGVFYIAQLSEMKDFKPSWSSITKHLERLAYKTEYPDLPPNVKPHIQFIKSVIPKMQAIEHAWRNRVMHIDTKLVPVLQVDRPIAAEIMGAVESFMRYLSDHKQKQEEKS
jgi:hypothetical protein